VTAASCKKPALTEESNCPTYLYPVTTFSLLSGSTYLQQSLTSFGTMKNISIEGQK